MARRRSSRRTWRGRAVLGACALLGAVATSALLPFVSSGGRVGPGEMTLDVTWGSGGTALQVPPLGQVIVDSHRLPLRVETRVVSIDLEAAQRLAGDRDPTSVLADDARSALEGMLLRFVAWSVVLAVLTGIVVGLVLPRRRLASVLAAVAGGLVAIVVLLGSVWLDYDVDAFAEPRFEGALERAPELLDAVEREYGNLQGLRDRAEVLAGQLQILARQGADPGFLAQ